MVLDIIFAIVLVLAVLKGLNKGLIVGVFSFVAVIIGLAAALKLSVVVASRIGKTVKVSEEWLPLLSFVVVFLLVVLLIRLGAKAIERTVEIAMLGWVNKLGGMIFYAAMYTIVFSVVLFYAEEMHWIKPGTIQASVTYPFVQPWGPKAINGLAAVIPVFKNMFGELEHFFEQVSKTI